MRTQLLPLAAGRSGRRIALLGAAAAAAGLLAAAGPLGGSAARAGVGAGVGAGDQPWFRPGNLVVSGSSYTGQADLLTPGVSELPPGCVGSACTPAVADGRYPFVFNNDGPDASFGVTSPIFLDQVTPGGRLVNTLRVPDGALGLLAGTATTSSPVSPPSRSWR